MQFGPRKRRSSPTIIVVPLIDILIVLLIFLVVTTTFRHRPALKLDLPQSAQTSTSRETAANDLLVVTVEPDSPNYWVGTLPVTFDKLQAELASRVQDNPEFHLIIRTDKKTAVQEVLKVIDAAKAANIKSINLEIKRVGVS